MLCLAISLVHSIKLKLEFAVLGKLVQSVTTNLGSSHDGPRNTVLTLDKQNSDQAFPHFFDPNRAINTCRPTPNYRNEKFAETVVAR